MTKKHLVTCMAVASALASSAYECSDCHSLAETSVNQCNGCHVFASPEGWAGKDKKSATYGPTNNEPVS